MIREEFLQVWPGFAKDYHPSPEALRRIGNVTLCMVIGPSGVGKSTLIERSGFSFVPSDTTRAIRPGEREAVDMYFRKDYDQVIADIEAGRFAQIAQGAEGDLYATKYTSYPKEGLAAMPVMADVVPVFRKLGFKETISAFIVPPSYEEWTRRMGSHDLSPEQLQKRLFEAKHSYKFALDDRQIRFVLNDTVKEGVARLKQVVDGQNPEDEALARQTAKGIYQKLLEDS